ncbi:MAG TPA: ABC transporter ATP-binding protein [Bacillales bacterium]|nr:ABC transporter ATP-binding protein [Bacillales bacterium]
MKEQTALQFTDVSFTYSGKSPAIVEKLNFNVKDGEFVSIIGPSGSGKTTLFRLITGLENPTAGDVIINGSASSCRLGSVGYMPQQDLLLPWRTVLENVTLPLEMEASKQMVSKVELYDLLQEFGLKGIEHSYPAQLSGGMKQRVSFLRTIITGSNILLLDEPFSALDAITRLTMQEWLLEKWEKMRKTILFITHDVDEALFLSDRIFVINGTPIEKFTEVTVSLSRPRKIRDLARQEIVNIKEQLIDQLRMKVHHG